MVSKRLETIYAKNIVIVVIVIVFISNQQVIAKIGL